MTPTYELIKQGLLGLQAGHDEAEEGKAGDLRVGNSGAVLDDGSVMGKCVRLTYLRLIGVVSKEPNWSSEFMFAAGRTNEDSWVEMLTAAGIPAVSILREEEISVEWEVLPGQRVTGRPDIVLTDWVGPEEQVASLQSRFTYLRRDLNTLEGADRVAAQDELTAWVKHYAKAGILVPKKVLEMKLVCSIWQARRVAFQDQPQVDHMLQAAHYLWKLGEQTGTEGDLKCELWYTNRVNYSIGYGKAQSLFPKKGEPGSECIQYNDDGTAFQVIPFIVGYELKWNSEGVLEYRKLGSAPGMWRETLLTKESIVRYYRTAAEMRNTQVLPPRPLKMNALGEKISSSPCSYCALAPVCDKKEKGPLGEWVDEVKKWVPMLPATGSISIKK